MKRKQTKPAKAKKRDSKRKQAQATTQASQHRSQLERVRQTQQGTQQQQERQRQYREALEKHRADYIAEHGVDPDRFVNVSYDLNKPNTVNEEAIKRHVDQEMALAERQAFLSEMAAKGYDVQVIDTTQTPEQR